MSEVQAESTVNENEAIAAPAIELPAGYVALERKFNFKARNLYDEAGKPNGKGKKQPSVVAVLPMASHETVAAFLADTASKESALIMAAVEDLIYAAARNQFDEIIDGFEGDDSRTVSPTMLDLAKLDLTYIANLPPSSRASTVPDEEAFNTFFADYLAVMPAATGKLVDAIKRHITYYTKPNVIKANKPVLELLMGQIDVYLTQAQNVEETAGTASYIRNKFDKWFKEPEKTVDVNLL